MVHSIKIVFRPTLLSLLPVILVDRGEFDANSLGLNDAVPDAYTRINAGRCVRIVLSWIGTRSFCFFYNTDFNKIDAMIVNTRVTFSLLDPAI